MNDQPIRVTVWGEYIHERENEDVRRIYPQGMHAVIAAGIQQNLGARAKVRTATLQEPEHGLSEQTIAETDVLVWWGHLAHEQVAGEVVDRIQQAVLDGMGLIVLHSGHFSRIFRRLMGTSCVLRWREAGEREVVWTVNPGHPIATGVGDMFVVPQQEMYGEYFDIPQPDELVFISSFAGGEVFRSGCCFVRGAGRIFYFSPGHETHPVYYQPEIRRVIANAVGWAAPRQRRHYDFSNPVIGWFDQS